MCIQQQPGPSAHHATSCHLLAHKIADRHTCMQHEYLLAWPALEQCEPITKHITINTNNCDGHILLRELVILFREQWNDACHLVVSVRAPVLMNGTRHCV